LLENSNSQEAGNPRETDERDFGNAGTKREISYINYQYLDICCSYPGLISIRIQNCIPEA